MSGESRGAISTWPAPSALKGFSPTNRNMQEGKHIAKVTAIVRNPHLSGRSQAMDTCDTNEGSNN